ncbi:acyltransferase [Flavobacterium sp.]|jgi:peptidoglycan/LPS O-acetylase OafA/YrhL|uniref:acyltransferase family protein n=1 Tax=Flavobacterium TaxID=237 RepID=UPI0022C1A8B7|nr:acyltransferase [Flavobacterium sp.]MCZ8089277.1 acyltransferase [Flavobacterium sp.]
MSKIYFPNLNGLRFIAALLVVIHHVEQFRKILGRPNYFDNPFIKITGKIGVILFFVLSGFLITYLLIKEQQESNTISISDFYKRRILRIWPLYFLLIIIAFFILPNISFFNIGKVSEALTDNFGLKLFLFVFFLPNLALGLFPPIPFASQAWSIGYEEQLYLVWPWIVKLKKNITVIILSLVSMFYLSNVLAFTVFKDILIEHDLVKVAEIFYDFPAYDSLLIGGFLAYLSIYKRPVLTFFFTKYFQVALYLITILSIVYGFQIPFVNNLFYAILFALIIANLALNEKSVLNLENKGLNYFGKISYGVYMYHSIAIIIVLKLLPKFNLENVFLEYLFSVLITLAISTLSFEFFENIFIKKKVKFSRLK